MKLVAKYYYGTPELEESKVNDSFLCKANHSYLSRIEVLDTDKG